MRKPFQLPAYLPVFQFFIAVIFCAFFSINSIAQGKQDTTSYIQTVDVIRAVQF